MPRKLELSWIGSLRQWRKRRFIDGKRTDFYLGTGKGKGDVQSYARALAKWKTIEAGLDAKEQIARARSAYAVWGDLLANRDIPLDHPTAQTAIIHATAQTAPSDQTATPTLSASMQAWMDGKARMGEDRPVAPATPKAKTIGKHLDDYLAEQQRRYEHGKQFPHAPQHERIGAQRLIAYRLTVSMLRANWGDDTPLPTDEATLARLMLQFRNAQNALLASGTIKASTFNERIKTLRHFAGWLHEQYLVPSLPRKLTTICAKHRTEPSAKALDLPTIHRIWAEAKAPLRTYIALALNCGFYAGDIANLEHANIVGNYISINRHKTGVPIRYKLWAVTQQLLASNCNGTEQWAFAARDGGRLLRIEVEGNGKRWSEVDNDLLALTKRIGVKATFSRFRDTSSTKIESIDRSLTDLFDAHKDQRMARFYLDGSKVDLDEMFAPLDAAIDKLEAWYGLNLDGSANGSAKSPKASKSAKANKP